MSKPIDPNLAREEVVQLLRAYEGDYDYPAGLLTRAADLLARQGFTVPRPSPETSQRVRVTRTLIMEGPRWWVEGTLDRSWVDPDRSASLSLTATVRELPRVVEEIE